MKIDDVIIALNSTILSKLAVIGLIIIGILFVIFIVITSNLFKRLKKIEQEQEESQSNKDDKQLTYIQAMEKELEQKMVQWRENYSQKMLNVSTLLLRIRDIAGSLDKDKIFDTAILILEKLIGAKTGKIMLIDKVKDELYVVKDFAVDPETATVKTRKLPDESSIFKVDGENAVTFIAKNGGLLNIDDISEKPKLKFLFENLNFPVDTVISILLHGEPVGVIAVEERDTEIPFDKDARIMLHTFSSLLGMVIDNAQLMEMTKKDLMSTKKLSEEERKAKQRLKQLFEKYTSPILVDQLLENPALVNLGGEKRHMTVMFTDIRSFTTYSEKYMPEQVITVLNEYLDAMTNVIIEYQGTLDKFIGDAIMCFWGAPVPIENHAERAVLAAVSMLELLKELQESWKARDIEPFDIGIGINTGEMVVGNVGSTARMDYTVIGDEVNVGARLQELTRKYNVHIIISENTYELTKHLIEAEKIEYVTVKGKTKPVLIYNVKGLKEGAKEYAVKLPELKSPEVKSVSESSADIRGLEKVVCNNCQHENIGKNLTYCESCGMPL